jgi:hypothetical protein
MKIKSFILSCLLLSFVFSNAQKDSLSGTWRLIDGKMIFNNPTSFHGSKSTYKQVLPTYPFSVVSKSTNDYVRPYAGNRMIADVYYRQPLDFSNIKSLLNENNVSSYKPDGNNWYRKGDLDPAKFRDIPYGAELLRSIFFDKPGNFRH